MASITVTLTATCAGGNHLTFTVSGDKSDKVGIELAQMQEPITDQEMQAFVKVTAKLARSGRTAGQARTLLQAGVVITV